jgi:pyrroline-5-carboxylate reductase
MGEAIIRSILAENIAQASEITVSDISSERRDMLSREYGVKSTAQNAEAVAGADVVVLAVKPQDIDQLMSELRPLTGNRIVISIAAGITLETLSKGLEHRILVRAMPNMPAQISEGVTVWTATGQVNEEQKEIARSILAASGSEIYVTSEKYIDMATAVSGSGPAYVFLIMEALADAAVHIGLSRDIAEKLVTDTMIGSALTVRITGKHPAELRNMVTSPAGTTSEGLMHLEAGALRTLLLEAVTAAFEKSKKMGG